MYLNTVERKRLREEEGKRAEGQGRGRGRREERKKAGRTGKNRRLKKIRNARLWYKGRVPKQSARYGKRRRQLLSHSELKMPAVEVVEVLEGREAVSNKESGKVPKHMGGATDRARP